MSPHFSSATLWRWGVQTQLVECFVRAQKSCSLPEARARIVREFLTFSHREWPECFCCVVSDLKRVDHGSEWAKAFSQITGRPFFSLQIRAKANHKQKTRKERYQERFVLPPTIKDWNGKTCWFVDDVLTTGATAKAVWLALGKPKGFHTVAQVYRDHPHALE